jgi:hypothetical protein
MTALSRRHPLDLTLRHEATGTFTIAATSRVPQIAADTLDEALRCAVDFASHQRVHVSCACDAARPPLADVTLLRRIWSEYIEMPGLRLTREQARRLWALDTDTCDSLLDCLVELKFLSRDANGQYGRRTNGPSRSRRRREAERARSIAG